MIIMIMIMMMMIREPWTELGELERFLEIPPEITERNFFFNSTKGFYCGKEELTLPQSKWTCTRDKCLSKSKVVHSRGTGVQ